MQVSGMKFELRNLDKIRDSAVKDRSTAFRNWQQKLVAMVWTITSLLQMFKSPKKNFE